ncbi:MAG: hypothetical protein ACI865_002279 [Flavobacteriaceae bacterium]|jgi:hypothetical protein
MVMKTELQTGENNSLYYSQITWSKNTDGSVTQLWETFSETGERLSVAFNATYRKVVK